MASTKRNAQGENYDDITGKESEIVVLSYKKNYLDLCVDSVGGIYLPHFSRWLFKVFKNSL